MVDHKGPFDSRRRGRRSPRLGSVGCCQEPRGLGAEHVGRGPLGTRSRRTPKAMFVVMTMVLGQSELIDFGIKFIAPDMVFFALAIYGYFKAK